jgi:hypothetical protein
MQTFRGEGNGCQPLSGFQTSLVGVRRLKHHKNCRASKRTLKLRGSMRSPFQVHISLGIGLTFNCGIRV